MSYIKRFILFCVNQNAVLNDRNEESHHECRNEHESVPTNRTNRLILWLFRILAGWDEAAAVKIAQNHNTSTHCNCNSFIFTIFCDFLQLNRLLSSMHFSIPNYCTI